jgi:hypothetical protein
VATFRLILGLLLLLCAAVIAWLGLAYHGYTEDYGSTPANTLWWAIPWTVATAVLGVLVIGAWLIPNRREIWSWLGLALSLVMALALLALITWS